MAHAIALRSVGCRTRLTLGLPLIAALQLTASVPASELNSQQGVEWFESRIRPVLVEKCYDCHNSTDVTEGGLAVDYREALLKGGDGGPILKPGNPQESRLLAILRHEIEGLEMPAGADQLSADVIADFERWIALGAPDPRDGVSSEDGAASDTWQSTLERRKKWWCFQPITPPRLPATEADSSPGDERQHPIDRFIASKVRDAELEPAPPAGPSTIVRRLYFNTIGLPPSSDEALAWTSRIAGAQGDRRDAVLAELVDNLLASPRFGERWARHWMDWIRYAETHGSEGDPPIDQAWRYRDYLIRAFNADVSVDQLIREHVAGDLLADARINAELGVNESAIGPAHSRMVFHGFAPTDALDERVRFTDDQINVFSKAFLGLTISCARCHDHKFDPISQADYYALFGILASCRPARLVIDTEEVAYRNRDALASLKPTIRRAIADDWIESLDRFGARWRAIDQSSEPSDRLDSIWFPRSAFHRALEHDVDAPTAWRQVVDAFEARRQAWRLLEAETLGRSESADLRWNLAAARDYAEWFAQEVGLPDRPYAAGEFAIAPEGEAALTGVYPAGVYSHVLSTKHAARLTSDDATIRRGDQLWVLACGGGEAGLRYVVQDYPRDGTVYPGKTLPRQWRWEHFDLSYWAGDRVHIELATAKDAPLLVRNPTRSWFGIRKAMIVAQDQPTPADSVEHLAPIVAAAEGDAPASVDELATIYRQAIRTSIEAWRKGLATNEQSMLLDQCIQSGLLPNQLDLLRRARPLITRFRLLEQAIAVPRRVPGLAETRGEDHPLLIRGDHKQPADAVPRRFLEAIDPTPYETRLSGRLQLASDLLRQDNPLTRRVMANRVWAHLFGQGLVRTPDNFGRMGARPSHPELLDWLALRFEEDGWSLKKLIRLILTSDAWQRSVEKPARAAEVDPENLLLSHAHARRLEAEAIRDALLSVSGQIEHQLGGPSVNGDSPRRSVYVRVVRNSLDPLLRTFDFPEPFSAVGRRNVTNVPAQSLLMLNSPQVSAYADAWARRLVKEAPALNEPQRIQRMFSTAFARPATADELQLAQRYLASMRRALQSQESLGANPQSIARQSDVDHLAERSDDQQTLRAVSRLDGLPSSEHPASDEIALWAELARAMLTFKEFIYVR